MISILMPIYNGIEFLQESFDSIQKQTFAEWELLIGINGHEKNSYVVEKAKQIVQTEERVRIFNFTDIRSKSKTLNRLCDFSQNDILCILDVDDYWEPTKLQKQVKVIDQYDVVGSGCQYFGESTAIPNLPFGEIRREIFYFYNPIINSSSMFYKKDARWDESLEAVEDYDMWLRLNKENKKFFNIKEKLCFHRIHKASFFNTKDNTLIEKSIKEKWL